MKTTRFFAALCSFSAVLALSASCQKEPVIASEDASGANLKTVTLTVGLPEETKINSNSKTPTQIQWNSSKETIGVIAKVGDVVKYYEFSGTAGAVSPTLEVSCSSVDDGAQLLYAVYPSTSYDHENNPWDGVSESIPLSLDKAQGFSTIGITSKALLVAKILGTGVNLKHVCGYLKIAPPERYQRWTNAELTTTKPSTDLKKFTITSTSAIAGAVGVSFNADGSIKTVDTSNAAEKTITVTTKKNTSKAYKAVNTEDSEGFYSPGAMFIPVLPGTYSDFDFTLDYRSDINGVAVASSTVHSTGTNTIASGVALGGDDGIVLSGPFAETCVMTGVTKTDATTLSLSASAKVWTYSGIKMSDYAFKFCYRDTGAAEWTEIDGAYSEGNVTATATVAADKVYEAKLKIVAFDNVFESAAKAEAGISSVTFDFSTKNFTFAYFTDGAESGYHKYVNAEGNDIFPNHNVSDTPTADTYWIMTWNGSGFDAKAYATSNLKTLGMTLTNGDYQVKIEHCTKHYTISGGVWCPNNVYIRLFCPTGKTIMRVLVEVDAHSSSKTDRKLQAAIGNANNNKSVVAQAEITAYGKASEAGVSEDEKGKNKSIDMVIPSATAGTDYWLYVNSRCSRFTVYYED